jgi:cation diffusion facilitator CzcD-associated flavoprotein CzcO
MFEICIIGAGVTGVDLAYHCRKQGIGNVIILEKRDSVGGVWNTHQKKYTGMRWITDTPEYFYHISGEHKKRFYHFFKRCDADKNLARIKKMSKNLNIKFNSEVLVPQYVDNY